MWSGISGLFWVAFPWWLRMLNIFFFQVLLSHSVFLRWEFFVQLWAPFLMGLFDFLDSTFLSFLNILVISPLSDLGLVKILSQSVGGLFVLLTSVFCLTEALQFYEVPFVDSPSYSTSHWCSTQEFFAVPISSTLFPIFSSISFSVSGFMWRSLIHLDLSFVQGDKNGSILLHDNCQLSQHHLLKMLSFSPTGWF